MKKYLRKVVKLIGIAMLVIACCVSASDAGDFPVKPVTMICAYSAGGGSDLVARLVAKYAEKYLGEAIVVENRVGAGGQIGFTALSRAKADGYTIGMLNVPAMNMLALVRDNCSYATSDFEPIANVIIDPVVLAVGSNSEFSTLDEFLSYAKANPQKLILGVDGPQTNAQLQPMIMEKAMGIEVQYVFYNGAAPALTAAIGGHTDGTTPGASEALQYVQNGQMRVLAVFANERFPGLPDVPTFKEVTGVDIQYVPSYRGFGCPVGVQKEIRDILTNAIHKAVNDPEFLQRASEMDLPIFFEDGDTFKQSIEHLEKEIINYKDMLK